MNYPYLLLDPTDISGRVFAIGDIHGCHAELVCLLTHLEKKEHLAANDLVVFMGDYIDRGPDSRRVVDKILDFKKKFPLTKTLRGNHEEMLLSYLDLGGSNGEVYLGNGGEQTMLSYGVESLEHTEGIEKIPREHIDFYLGLERLIVSDRYIFVHAGIDPLRPLDSQPDETIYWIREEFIFGNVNLGKVVVFGHTPFQDVFGEKGNKLGVDTGAVFGNKLSCVELTRGRVFQVQKGQQTVDVRSITL
jgi:serine/threonine protein phosphatase 1